jgi:hypothetical protein
MQASSFSSNMSTDGGEVFIIHYGNATKKSSLEGHVDHEAEDSSGERYTIRQMNL